MGNHSEQKTLAIIRTADATFGVVLCLDRSRPKKRSLKKHKIDVTDVNRQVVSMYDDVFDSLFKMMSIALLWFCFPACPLSVSACVCACFFFALRCIALRCVAFCFVFCMDGQMVNTKNGLSRKKGGRRGSKRSRRHTTCALH